jgi:uncharacterized protein YndB with AHSA1/START domain
MADRQTTHASFSIEKTYDAKPARVFRAFADADIKKQWFKGGDELEYSLDFRVGGREVNKGRFHDGPVHSFIATYYDIVENERIVTAYEMYLDDDRISVSIGTTELEAHGDKTKLVYTEQGAFLDGFDKPEMRERGTVGLLETLGEFLAGAAVEA